MKPKLHQGDCPFCPYKEFTFTNNYKNIIKEKYSNFILLRGYEY